MLLAVDATTKTASVAIYDAAVLKVHNTVNNGYTHSQTLLTLIDQSLSSLGKAVTDLTAIVVANGPGSFTGIRIALATVKALAHARGIPVYTASTLLALSYHGEHFSGLVCPILDARRSQVYSAVYDRSGQPIVGEATYKIAELVDIISRQLTAHHEQQVLFCGDGVAVHRDYLSEKLADKAVLGTLDFANNCAVGLIAAHLKNQTLCYRYDEVAVNYLRQSQAERERQNT